MADKLSLDYRTTLALVKEEAGQMKALVFLRNQNIIEEQRRVAHNVRRIEGKAKGGGTNKITLVDNEKNKVELVKKVDTTNVMAVGNAKVGPQTEGGSQLLRPDFIQ